METVRRKESAKRQDVRSRSTAQTSKFGTNSGDTKHTLLNFIPKSPIVLGSSFQESSQLRRKIRGESGLNP